MVLSLPATPSYRDGRFRLVSNAARFVSPLTRVGQTVARVGDLWTCSLSLPPLTQAQARVWGAVIAALSGQRNSVYVPPPMLQDDLGAVGTPLVNGAGLTGTTLPIDGLPAGKTIPAGTWLSYDTSTFRFLHMTTSDITADGGGAASLAVMPAIRKSPPDNAPIDFTTPTCEMILEDGMADVLILQQAVTYGVSLSLVENVRS